MRLKKMFCKMYLRYDKLEKNALEKGHYLYANKCRDFKMRHVIKCKKCNEQ